MGIAGLKGGGAAGQNHDVGQLRGVAKAGGAADDAPGTVSLNKRFRDEAARPRRRVLQGRHGTHDATVLFHKKASRPRLPSRHDRSFGALP